MWTLGGAIPFWEYLFPIFGISSLKCPFLWIKLYLAVEDYAKNTRHGGRWRWEVSCQIHVARARKA
jgi:hypothetical protein